MKKVCFVADSFLADPASVITGPQVQIYRIGKEMLQRGWEVHVVAYRTNPTLLSEPFEGLTLHWIPKRGMLPLLGSFRILRRLWLIDAATYYQRGRDVLSGILGLYCLLFDKRMVWASAGELGVERSKYRLQTAKKKRNPFLKFLLYLEAWANDMVCEFGIRHATFIVVQTQFQQNRLRTSFGRSSLQVGSGHSLSSETKRDDQLTVLWIGSLKPVKRPELFLELAQRCADLPCRFILAGQFADLSYEYMFKKRLLASKVEYLGPIPFGQSDTLIGSAHCLVNTTEPGYEGIPNSFIQAWIHGTLTISFAADPDELIKEQQLGLVSCDLDEIYEFLKEISQQSEKWYSRSVEIKQYAQSRFSIETVVNKLEPLFNASDSA